MSKEEKDSKKSKPARGGFREGAGRPAGSTSKLQMVDCMDAEEIATVIDTYIEQAKKNPKTTQHFIDHIFGRAKTTLAGDPENPLFNLEPIKYIKEAGKIAEKYEKDLKAKLQEK